MALLCACANVASNDSQVVQTAQSDSSGITIVTISGSVSDLPVWSISARPLIETGGDSQPVLGAVGEVVFLSDGRLLIEDNQTAELYLFNVMGSGSLVGRSGDGPGEFRSIDVLTVTAGDTVFAYDRRLNRVSVLDPHGALLGNFPIDASFPPPGSIPQGVWAVDSDHLVLYTLGPRDAATISGKARRDQRTGQLFALDESGQLRSHISVPFIGGYTILAERVIIVSPFANTPIVTTGRQHVIRGSGIDYDLVVHDRDLNPVRIIRWPGWAERLTPAILASARADVAEVFAGMFKNDPEAADLLVDATFDEELLPDTLPALGSAILDDRGRIWVT